MKAKAWLKSRELELADDRQLVVAQLPFGQPGERLGALGSVSCGTGIVASPSLVADGTLA